mmetsp:Transcript_9525/g.28798  ORF Transcript_9525/g.28798 Transcript_9525/m.28798 type:complete len:121 (+) Transcript_9525:123-485(+)
MNAKAISNELGTLQKKLEEAEAELKNIETAIFEEETEYLRDTLARGNAVRGWESFWRRADKSSSGSHGRKVKASERIFSSSSTSGARDESLMDPRSSKKSFVSGGVMKKKKLKKKVSDSE